MSSAVRVSAMALRFLWIINLVLGVYIAFIAEVAVATGAFYVMFPELGALSHDVYTRPRGTWASSPLLLAITPAITGPELMPMRKDKRRSPTGARLAICAFISKARRAITCA